MLNAVYIYMLREEIPKRKGYILIQLRDSGVGKINIPRALVSNHGMFAIDVIYHCLPRRALKYSTALKISAISHHLIDLKKK